RNDIGGREDDEAEAGEDQQDRHKPFSGEQPKIEERLLDGKLARNEGEREQAPRKQKSIDEAVVDPIEAVALVEAGIEKRKTEAGVGEPWPVEVAQEGRVDLLARRSVPDAGEHDRQRRAILPFDPTPRQVVRVPALERCRDVLRQL